VGVAPGHPHLHVPAFVPGEPRDHLPRAVPDRRRLHTRQDSEARRRAGLPRDLGQQYLVRVAVHLIPEEEDPLDGVGERAARACRGHEGDIAPGGREHALEGIHEGGPHLGHLVHLDDAKDREAALVQPVGCEVGRLIDELRLGGAAGEGRQRERGGQNEIEAAAP